jgi:phosphoribosyl 1,2-cyclic phosphate phosphodiesterase
MLEDIEVLVLDMLRFRHHPTHLTVDQAVEIATQIGASQTWFTHMTHCISHAEVDASLPASMNLSYDGLQIK